MPHCFQAGTSVFPAFGTKLKHQEFLGLEFTGVQTGTTPSSLLGLQLTDCKSGGLSSSIIGNLIPYI